MGSIGLELLSKLAHQDAQVLARSPTWRRRSGPRATISSPASASRRTGAAPAAGA